MSNEFQTFGKNAKAQFTLKIHRGDGMALIAMNWRRGKPPVNFVGFAIEYQEPGGTQFFALKNRLSFSVVQGQDDPELRSTLLSPIQKFRWVHFPRNAHLPGEFTYRVKPVFMDNQDQLSYGEPQTAGIELRRETYPGQLNVTFTRGFVSSQAFVDRYELIAPISTLIPAKAVDGLRFVPSHPNTDEALAWMGFETREAILDVLDQAVGDTSAQVRVIAYDLNEPEVVSRLEKLGSRLKIIIDDSADHGEAGSAENQAQKRLAASAGKQNVKRQHMGSLQHNKTIVVDGQNIQLSVCGSTNFSWRAFYVQANNAIVLQGKAAVKPFVEAFENFWQNDSPKDFGQTPSAVWTDLNLSKIDAKVAFSPHAKSNALLQAIADDIGKNTTSNLFYSLAFLYQTKGPIRDAIAKVTNAKKLFVYGVSDKKAGGLTLQKPNGNLAPVYASALSKNVPEPFKSEPTGGGGVRMHHKFVAIDFDKPSARIYLGSYNFSSPADVKNGENLLLIRDRRITVSYVIAAIILFDHYHFRVTVNESKKAKKELVLSKPPRTAKVKPWWSQHYTDARRIRDRELFA